MFRYKLRTLLIVLALGPPVLAQDAQLPILGKWRIVAQEAAGGIDDAEPDDEIVVFSDDHLLCDDDGKPVKCKCSYDSRTKPMRVEWDSPETDGMCGTWDLANRRREPADLRSYRHSRESPGLSEGIKSHKGDPAVKLLLFCASQMIRQLPKSQERPMFRFTIRDVLWLTVVVALAVGWWMDHREQSSRRDTTWAMLNRYTPAEYK